MTENSAEQQVIGFFYVMDGAQKGEVFKLYEGRNTIGTSPDCSIILDDPGVSAKHASLRHEDDTYLLRDLDSQNGTFVDGEEIVTVELRENEIILTGNTKLKFKML